MLALGLQANGSGAHIIRIRVWARLGSKSTLSEENFTAGLQQRIGRVFSLIRCFKRMCHLVLERTTPNSRWCCPPEKNN